MTSAIALARAELRILARDRVAAFNVVIVPLVAAAYLVANPPTQDIPGPVAASVAAVLLAVFTSAALVLKSVMVLAQRREQHLLERWRISGAAPPAILAGTLLPGVLLLVVGLAVMFPALAVALDHPPVQPVWLLLAVVLAIIVGSAAAIVAAAYARTTDGAAVVALPIFAALFGGGVWATLVPLGDITWRMRATGGGALTELVRIGWEGPTDGIGIVAAATATGPSLLVLLALTLILAVAATRTFRWDTRD
jgi:ABC-2 type transport system permease protein